MTGGWREGAEFNACAYEALISDCGSEDELLMVDKLARLVTWNIT